MYKSPELRVLRFELPAFPPRLFFPPYRSRLLLCSVVFPSYSSSPPSNALFPLLSSSLLRCSLLHLVVIHHCVFTVRPIICLLRPARESDHTTTPDSYNTILPNITTTPYKHLQKHLRLRPPSPPNLDGRPPHPGRLGPLPLRHPPYLCNRIIPEDDLEITMAGTGGGRKRSRRRRRRNKRRNEQGGGRNEARRSPIEVSCVIFIQFCGGYGSHVHREHRRLLSPIRTHALPPLPHSPLCPHSLLCYTFHLSNTTSNPLATSATKVVALLFCLDEQDALPDKLIMRTLLLEGGRAFSVCSEIFPQGTLGFVTEL